MATGISAEPIELVMFHPKTDEDKAENHNNPCPAANEAGLANMKYKAAVFKAMIGLLMYSPYGILKSYLGYKLANFLKAANDPVRVTPPMKTPMYEAEICNKST